MPKIDVPTLKLLLNTLPVLEALGIKAERIVGQNWYGPCPFHEDQDSDYRCFHVQLQRGVFRCVLCDAKGDMLTLARLVWGRPWRDAVERLCSKLGVEIPHERPVGKERGGGGL
jgi:DNA primase